ncbi:MAG TPA: DNA polymerase III subunit delta' [Methylovirgula sp.]|nr:DNA polymerase III subunit delta' [Methylovirgula sp.]
MAPRSSEAVPEADRLEGAPHPRETFELVGHAETERALLEAYKANRLPHAFIIGGEPGIGKATLAWRLARFLLAHPDPATIQAAQDLAVDPHHPAARRIAALSHSDLFLLRREWNEKTRRHFSEIRVDDVRQALHMFQRAAGAEGYRICIVDSADELNRSAANALLKLVEEPPSRSLFLIIAHRPALVLPTLRSRCRMLFLRPPSAAEILHVIDKLGEPRADAEMRRTAAERAQGSVSAALRLLAEGGLERDKLVSRLLDDLPSVDWRAVHWLADAVTGRDKEAEFDRLMASIIAWIDARLHSEAARGARRLAPLAEVWEKAAEAAREAEVMNLDKRPLILSIFADLAAARALAA